MTNSETQVLLYGAGGHARVIVDHLFRQGVTNVEVFDDQLNEGKVLNASVIGKYEASYMPHSTMLIAIGNNKVRWQLVNKLSHAFYTLIAQSADVSSFARIKEGTVAFQHVVVQANATVGKHCILNTSCLVEHDCKIGDFVHLAPNSTICGHVEVGEGSWLGAGTVVKPGVKIGKWATIAPGMAVTENVPDFSILTPKE